MFVPSIVVLIVFLVLFVAVLPRWSYSANWGNYPSIVFGLLIAICLIYILSGHFPLH